MSDDTLCETCLERGRERLAEIVTEDLQMCRNCFNGKATCREETIGGADEARATAKRLYDMRRRLGIRPRRYQRRDGVSKAKPEV